MSLYTLVILVIAVTVGGCGQCPWGGHTQPGSKGDAGAAGINGSSGSNGAAGANGANGHSVVFGSAPAVGCAAGGTTFLFALDINDNGILEGSDSNPMSATICNGVAGQNAPPTPYTPVALVDPCGDAPGRWDEVFLRLSNGVLLASFSDNAAGYNTRFSVLTPGTYVTTDGDSCVFTVNALGQIVNENHHY